ncbi:uncharacterized protein LOC127102824 [Lathyrus oleraceus]|uniref:uncharacterized protein LOC127102824 n=1 Tax=Pisum sativum TaxID=3888 RepID=UPI0021CF27BF|nr:uncharacterized protein LOC127102824 [Pisum sativum]
MDGLGTFCDIETAELKILLRARRRKARLELSESAPIVSESEKEEAISVHSEDSEVVSEPMTEPQGEAPPPPAERLFGDYGGANAPTGRLTIVNQPKEGESLGDAYKRFKRLLVACPTHNMEIKENEVVSEKVTVSEPVAKEKVSESKPVVKLPFPTRNKKKENHEKNFEKFLEMFKKLEINILFLEALEKMPSYAKFMKDIISKKRSIDTDFIVLTETCSAILQGMKIPIKKKDRGSVTIPCTIGDRSFKKALIDLGASVSLMPLSIYKRLGIGKVQDTRMTLQFADHSMKRPCGVVEDVLVKIDKFVFPVDFVILEMPED